MSDFSSGFIQGFSETLAVGILERRKEARDFFNKQVEYARTKGLENRQRVKSQVDQGISIARQLEAVGVPKDVIMAQINQNPENLGGFYEQVEKIRSGTGRDLTPEEWKAIYKVSGDFQAPDEDLSTFISRTYDPIANAASSPTFADDPQGNLLASMLGFNAMDRARAELSKTEIADGLTAEQLIRYGDVQPERVGGSAVVTTNYGALGLKDQLSISESATIAKGVADSVESVIPLMDDNQIAEGQDASSYRDMVIEDVATKFPMIPRSRIEELTNAEFLKRRYTLGGSPQEEAPLDTEMPSTAPETAPETPQASPATEGSQPAQEAPSPAPAASDDPLSPEERMSAVAAFKYLDIQDNGDGTVSVILSDGTARRYATSALRDALRQYATQ